MKDIFLVKIAFVVGTVFLIISPILTNAQSQNQILPPNPTISGTLHVGASNADVNLLQRFLKRYSDIYPEGWITGYFGPMTLNAVKKFQLAIGIEPVGIVGPRTRAYLNFQLAAAGANTVVDRTAPVISNIEIVDITADSARITWVTDDLSTSLITYSLVQKRLSNSLQISDGTWQTMHSLSISGLASSTTYYFKVASTNQSNKISDSAVLSFKTLIKVTTDTVMPVVSIVSPMNGTTASGTVAIIANATDNIGVAGVKFLFDGVPSGPEDIAAPYSVNWNTASSTDGSHIIIAIARDAAFNYATSSAISVTTINTITPPVATTTPPINPPPATTTPPTSYEERAVQITTNPANQERPAISGNKIVWSDKRNGGQDVFMYDLSTHIETTVTNGLSDAYTPHISGNYIVYSSGGRTYLYNINTSSTTDIGAFVSPKISGDNIVYAKYPYPSPRELYRYNIPTIQRVMIATNSSLTDPYISGNDIVYGGNGALYNYNLISGTERQVVTSNIPFRASVSNGIVAYTKRTGDTATGFDVYIYNLNTNVEKKLTNKGGKEPGSISISGNRVVWTDTDDYNIYLYDLSTDQLIQLTSNPSQQYHSYIDGNRVVWADYRNGNFDIYFLEL